MKKKETKYSEFGKSLDDLNDGTDSFKRQAAERQAQHKVFNDNLRSPDYFIPAKDEYSRPLMFWHVPEGLVMMEQYKDGYHREYLHLFSQDKCEAFVNTMTTTARNLDDKP